MYKTNGATSARGLEILIELTMEVEHNEKGQLCTKKDNALIRENYKDPVSRKFEDATGAILDGLQLSE